MCGNAHLHCTSIGQELIEVQIRDDKVTGTGVGIVRDEIQGQVFACGCAEDAGRISVILHVEDDTSLPRG